MGRAKDILVKPIAARDANRIVKALHYSGKVVQNSQIHFGVFLDGKCGGALQFGPSMDKGNLGGLVEGTKWNEFIELNRMALADWLPRNGESRVISCAIRLLRKQYLHLKWVVSYADGCQCGDGAIYRASGFVLTGIKRNTDLWNVPGIGVQHSMNFKTARPTPVQRVLRKQTGLATGPSGALLKAANAKRITGHQLRYIFFLDPSARERLTVPVIPFSEIDRRGIGMYKGKPRVRSDTSDTPG